MGYLFVSRSRLYLSFKMNYGAAYASVLFLRVGPSVAYFNVRFLIVIYSRSFLRALRGYAVGYSLVFTFPGNLRPTDRSYLHPSFLLG